MMIDLAGKSFVILGLKGTGKSTLANLILNTYGEKAFLYDTLYESPELSPFDIYRPKNRYSVAELEAVIRAIVPENINQLPKYRLFVIDEANRFCPPYPSPLPASVADLNDQCRHYLMSAGFIARRPSQLNSNLIELADYTFVFRLTGKNDLVYLNNTVSGLGDAVATLGKYEFMQVNPDKSYEVCEPITPDKRWLERASALINR
jgi:DNA helicase HerA-like ATPase